MSWSHIPVCDVCQRPKGEGNKWLLVAGGDGSFIVYRWDDLIARDSTIRHVCGQSCLFKLLGEFLSSEVQSNLVKGAV
jgi:hypothetical protein